MALKKGKCINCGSLLMLDPDMPKGHCLFCDCVFDNEEAFRAYEHPEAFTFPNDPQPPYEGPSLDPLPYQRGPVVVAQQEAAKPKKPDYVLPKKKIPDLKIPRKDFYGIIGVIVALFAIFCAITIPLMNKKEKENTEIRDRFVQEVEGAQIDLAIYNTGHDRVIAVLHEDISPEEGVKLFNDYCDIRADVLNMKDRSFEKTRKTVWFRIAMPGGGYVIANPENEAALADAVKNN